MASKHRNLADGIVATVDEQFGERSSVAKWLFRDFAGIARENGLLTFGKVFDAVADNYDYGDGSECDGRTR